MEITKSQLNYLIAIKQLMGTEVSQKYICAYLGVKKPTASIALKNLEETGYITHQDKGGINEYSFTEKALKIVAAIEREHFEFVSLFCTRLGMPMDTVEEEYKRVCGDFSEDFIKRLAEIHKNDYSARDESESEKHFCGLGEGEYEIPFQVVQDVEGMPSMGDRGFIHPARLIVSRDRQDIILESKSIYYKSKDEQMLKGKLSSFSYSDGNARWIAAEEVEENKWLVPVKNILCQNDSFGRPALGIVKIKAKATTKKMPESSAEICFNFKLVKKL